MSASSIVKSIDDCPREPVRSGSSSSIEYASIGSARSDSKVEDALIDAQYLFMCQGINNTNKGKIIFEGKVSASDVHDTLIETRDIKDLKDVKDAVTKSYLYSCNLTSGFLTETTDHGHIILPSKIPIAMFVVNQKKLGTMRLLAVIKFVFVPDRTKIPLSRRLEDYVNKEFEGYYSLEIEVNNRIVELQRFPEFIGYDNVKKILKSMPDQSGVLQLIQVQIKKINEEIAKEYRDEMKEDYQRYLAYLNS